MFPQTKNIVCQSRLLHFICTSRLNLKSNLKVHNKFGHSLKVYNSSCTSIYCKLNSGISIQKNQSILQKNCSFGTEKSEDTLQDSVAFEAICEETLESLCEFFDDLVEARTELRSADVSFGDGVLTVNLGPKFGTYVINRQSPNRQIWLSSPTSGPKRYDYVPSRDTWIYRHNPECSLHELLQTEIEAITQSTISLSDCAHCGTLKH